MPRFANLASIWDVKTVDTGDGQALAVSIIGGGAGGATDVNILSGPTSTSALQVQGPAADGAAAVGNPVQVAGKDGATLQTLATDSNGFLKVMQGAGTNPFQIEGPNGDGTPISNNPILIGGQQEGSTNVQNIKVDSDGNLQVDILAGPTGANAIQLQGPAADGAAAVGNPVQVAGKDDSGNAQSLHTDTSGDIQTDVLTLPGASFVSGTADAVVKSGAGKLVAIQLCAADAADCAITVYDNTSASGTIIVQLKATALTDTNFCPAYAINVTNGIYVDVTTGGPPRWTAVYI